MKMPKQDSDVSAKVDCFWHREGVASPSHYLPILYYFPYFLAIEKAIKLDVNDTPGDGVRVRLFVFLSMRFARKLRQRKK